MRPNKKRRPDGRTEVEVEVQRRHSDRLPMEVKIDLDAIRETAAKMNDLPCSPDAVVETIKSKIAAGEVDRIYAAMLDKYAQIAEKDANGDAFAFIEMEFLAFRQIMDDEVPDFRPDIHEDVLAAALSFKVRAQILVAGALTGKKRRACKFLSIPTPLVRKRNDALAAIQLAIVAAASRAKRIGAESYRLWRDALEVVTRRDFGVDGDMRREDINRLTASLREANMILALDAMIADYVPLSAANGEGKESDDVL